MDEFDSNVYYGIKGALRKVRKMISDEQIFFGLMPVILIDLNQYEVFCFDDEHDAQGHLENQYSEWDEEPPNGEDEDLILLKFCSEFDKETYPATCKNYVFWREINGKKFYRERTFVEFEPELIINVHV